MKKLLVTLALIGSAAFAAEVQIPAKTPEQLTQLLDFQESVHYTGCIDGFLVTIEQKWYVRPKGADPRKIFEALRDECKTKSVLYRLEQSMMHQGDVTSDTTEK